MAHSTLNLYVDIKPPPEPLSKVNQVLEKLSVNNLQRKLVYGAALELHFQIIELQGDKEEINLQLLVKVC